VPKSSGSSKAHPARGWRSAAVRIRTARCSRSHPAALTAASNSSLSGSCPTESWTVPVEHRQLGSHRAKMRAADHQARRLVECGIECHRLHQPRPQRQPLHRGRRAVRAHLGVHCRRMPTVHTCMLSHRPWPRTSPKPSPASPVTRSATCRPMSSALRRWSAVSRPSSSLP